MTDSTTLPPGWASAELQDIASTQLGKMLSKKAKTGLDEQPYLRNQNVQWGRFDLDDVATMAFTDEEREKFAVLPGDVLVCEGGIIGRAAVWRRAETMYFQKALHRVRCADGVRPDYIAYALRHMAAAKLFDGHSSGSTISHLPQEDLRRLPIALPPAAEQGRIVAEIERRLSHVDAAEVSLDTALRQTRRARVAVLRAATDGSLLSYEPVGDANRECESAGVGCEPVADRPRWARVRLGDIAKVGSGSTPKRGNPRYWDGGTIPWVTSGQVVGGVVSEPAELITQAALEETSVKLWPAGTLLVAMYGEGRTRGHCAELAIEATCNQACAAISLHPGIADAQPFLKLVLQARYEENRVLGSGGVQENLNLGLIKNITIDLPPRDAREALGAEVDRRLSLLAAAEAGITKQRTRCARARRSVLSAAFAGGLVPQDPNDEPAGQLLERIQAERAAATPSKRTRRHTPQETAK